MGLPFIGDSALGSTYLLMKFWTTSSESLKSELSLLFAWRWTAFRVSFKSAYHHTNLFTSTLLYTYLGDRANTRSASQVPLIWGSNIHRKDWFWVFVCDRRRRRQRRCRWRGRGKLRGMFYNGCWWRRCCSCTSRRTLLLICYQKGSYAACVGPVSPAVDYWERHLVVPFGWVRYGLPSRGLRVRIELGILGWVETAMFIRSIILYTD